ncbi:phage major capsid protein [Sphingorhabdus pulchriflava]|uniref:Phage major capsid protein n=1 Tax=Sphingorhabdus pulchriflava TaxID=2292257 RepID=A0A371BEP8_9SPHN|nr:phage major capsid protein [Sphingorhabdus pulchriflava]RDV06075.1 phage major capsid protein [Sphingorhabdus pulchriflava]
MDYEVKADPLEAAFDAAVIPAAVVRPQLAAGNMADPARSAFVEGYLRKGHEVELKSFAGNEPADGGYAVPKEIDAVIDATLKAISPIRAVANVVQVGSAGYRKLVTTNGVASGWASEVAARPTTATPTFNEIVPSFGELYANPAATQAMLDDAQFDVEAWLADEIATQFAKAEGTAFVNGDGVDKPKGFLTYTAVATGDATRTFGQLQYVPVGAASDFPATNPQDKLLDLVHALRAPYRQGAVWVMNSATLAKIRKFKTSDGAFVWTPGLVTGQPDTLLGYPVVESEDMPDIAANSMPIAFGNFRAGYLIAERSETNILRDPYSNKPYVNFYATKRIGGAVSNSEAIKLLRIAAS